MSMSTHVIGIKPPDEKWLKMKAVWDACTEAGTSYPEEVVDFFNGGETPDDAGVVVQLSQQHISVRAWKDDSCDGFEVNLKALPPDVTVLRFYNSW